MGVPSHRAAEMFPQRRPYPAPGIAAAIAIGGGDANAGGIVTVGPQAFSYGLDGAQVTIIHEFVHAIHLTNVPRDGSAGLPVTEV